MKLKTQSLLCANHFLKETEPRVVALLPVTTPLATDDWFFRKSLEIKPKTVPLIIYHRNDCMVSEELVYQRPVSSVRTAPQIATFTRWQHICSTWDSLAVSKPFIMWCRSNIPYLSEWDETLICARQPITLLKETFVDQIIIIEKDTRTTCSGPFFLFCGREEGEGTHDCASWFF